MNKQIFIFINIFHILEFFIFQGLIYEIKNSKKIFSWINLAQSMKKIYNNQIFHISNFFIYFMGQPSIFN